LPAAVAALGCGEYPQTTALGFSARRPLSRVAKFAPVQAAAGR
jgi:hypothetical protein